MHTTRTLGISHRAIKAALKAAGLAVLWVAGARTAQAFPDKPVRIVAGFAPGGADVSARLIAQKLQELWGQTVIMDNKPGAAGNLGADAVARAPADGHTVLLVVNSYTINTTVYKNLSWDLLRDFAPVGRYGRSPMVVLVNSTVPVKDLKGLVALAKSQPGKLNYGSAGVATAPHLVVEWFATLTGTDFVHVPYKGSAPSVMGLVGNEVQFAFGALSAFEPMIKDGRVRALAVTTAQRHPEMPDLATVAEQGVAGFDADIWYGFAVPAATPVAIVQKLAKDLQTVLADADLQTKLRARGVEPAFLEPARMAELMRKDVVRWREVAERIKLKLD
jgi:tripartite-type tricarboxylate transporter receptor subunit TctC